MAWRIHTSVETEHKNRDKAKNNNENGNGSDRRKPGRAGTSKR